MDKTKIVLLSDHPLSTSGVGTQSRWLIDGLVATGRYSFRCFGGAIKHEDYRTVVINDDFMIKPTDGFGNPTLLRQVLVTEKPDVLMLFTDPRFFLWVWSMEDEIHQICPIAYNHLWDNYPAPDFNKPLYESTDLINCINYPTYEMVSNWFPERTNYVPHAVPDNVYKILSNEEIKIHKRNILGPEKQDHFIALYVGRNARRKMVNDIIISWKMFLENLEKKHGHQRATLIMHTDPHDSEGANLYDILEKFNVSENNVIFSKERLEFEQMNVVYNIADVQLNRSCFAGDTKVVTSEGYKPIEEIRIGDSVLTHQGRWRSVTQTITNPPSNNVYSLSATGMNPVIVTGDHQVMAIKKSSLPKRYLINENIGDFVSRGKMMSVEELKVGDYVVGTLPEIEKQTNIIQYDMFSIAEKNELSFISEKDGYLISNNNSKNDRNHGKRFIDLDEDFAYVLGEFVGDGSTNSTSVSFNKNDNEKINKFIDCLERSTGLKANINVYAKHVNISASNGSVLKCLFRDLCGLYSKGKQIPDDIMKSSLNIKKAFLDGYTAADGAILVSKKHKTVPLYRTRTISHKLAFQLKILLADMGIVIRSRYGGNSHGFNKQGMIWTQEYSRIKNNGHQFNGSCRSWVHDRIIVSRINKLKQIDYDLPVYDLTVEEDHTYMVENITVHNCNEGFGLPILEGKLAGTPAISIKTGGLTRQVEDYITGKHYGVALDPEVSNCVGNQMVPYIYEDFVSNKTYANAIMKMFEMSVTDREELGKLCRTHVQRDYNMDDLIRKWDESLQKTVKTWRDNYQPWEYKEI